MLVSSSKPSNEARDGTEQGKREKPRVPALHILPSDRFPFSVHLDVVKRFVMLSHNGTQAMDSGRVEGEGVPTQAGQLNVRFLKSIGILRAADRGLYLPTPEAIRFISARTVGDDKARPILAALVGSSWFVSTAQGALSPTKPVKEGDFLGELAIAAQTDKEKKEGALQVLLEYLVYSGIVRRDDEGLRLSATGPMPSSRVEGSQVSASSGSLTEGTFPQKEETAGLWHSIQTEDFTLKIRSDMEAFEDLQAHLQTLKRKIERIQVRRSTSEKDASSAASE